MMNIYNYLEKRLKVATENMGAAKYGSSDYYYWQGAHDSIIATMAVLESDPEEFPVTANGKKYRTLSEALNQQ